MPKLRVHAVSMSADGFIAGPNQSLEAPLGEGARPLHQWIFETRTGRAMFGDSGGEDGLDDDLVAAGFDNIGATIMGRNMFGPVRGPWSEPMWRGWWDESPPFNHSVFVLTHFAHESLHVGGTDFHFVTGGVHEAYERAYESAGDRDIRLGGGAQTIREFLDAGLVDTMHIAVVAHAIGSGERLFAEQGLPPQYRCSSMQASPRAAHFFFDRQPS
jgi:dihydrofolate reductase